MNALTRMCNKCGETKTLSDFHNNSHNPYGRQYPCKICERKRVSIWRKNNPEKAHANSLKWQKNNPEKVRMQKKKYYLNNPTKMRDQYLRFAQNITLSQYEEMFKNQNGICAICGQPEYKRKNLYVDHCHRTNKIRGLLCNDCNSGIGFMKDNIKILESAIKYLISSK